MGSSAFFYPQPKTGLLFQDLLRREYYSPEKRPLYVQMHIELESDPGPALYPAKRTFKSLGVEPDTKLSYFCWVLNYQGTPRPA